METYLLFDCCKIIQGYTRSMVLDTQRKAFYFIPNDLAFYIDRNGVIEENEDTVELIQFLMEEELAFKCDSSIVQQFITSKNSTWDYPARISNAILSCSEFNEVYLGNLVTQLTETLQCKYVEFRFSQPLSLDTVSRISNFISQSNLLSFSLAICLEDIPEDKTRLEQILLSNTRLFKTIIFNSPEEGVRDAEFANYGNIFFTRASNLELSCGIVSDVLFTTDSSHYYESLAHNSCLNRKLAVDAEGNIKNCPSMTKNYGNVRDVKLIEAVNTPEFQQVWHLKKDDIDKCRDCEFRHICTDCRAFVDEPGNDRSAPLKCGYDPYTGEWQEWSSLSFKQKAIDFYNMQSLVTLKTTVL